MEIISIENLNYTYPNCKEKALCNINLKIIQGEFITLCGATGCGKSTLLRLLKKELTQNGKLDGTILIDGENIDTVGAEKSARNVGFVAQRTEEQIVTDKVWHELAFGLENLNLKTVEIERRIAEIATFFGIEDWFNKSTAELSGGQKQLLNLASVVAMQPKVIVLDEPTSQLDPVTAGNFLSVLKRINRELSITVIIAEHRLEELFAISDKVLFMENGTVSSFGTPQEVVQNIKPDNVFFPFLPTPVQLFIKTNGNGICPFSVTDGKKYITENFKNDIKSLNKIYPEISKSDVALSFKNVFFKYAKNSADILSDMSLKIYRNEIFCLVGGNGTGKTTALLNMAGVVSPYRGKIEIFAKNIKSYKGLTLYDSCLAMLPQDVQNLFSKNTVAQELENIENPLIDLTHLSDKHPYDLSGGEQQKLALNIVFSTNPQILLLDEPTKCIDAVAKLQLVSILKQLKRSGVTVIVVTHDADFAARIADRCAFCFRGKITSVATIREFFCNNNFFTTSVCRMTKGYYGNTILLADLLEIIKKNGGCDVCL